LKIAGGSEPLDDTFIHPESYKVTREFLTRLPQPDRAGGHGTVGVEKTAERVRAWRALASLGAVSAKSGDKESAIARLAKELDVGTPTLTDIIENLEKPGLDPRDALPAPILRHDVLKLEDLREGMLLQGTVRNVVDFGAFVDIGVKQDGLVHVSE